MTRTFCIAEAGSCHDGEYEKALRLITVAKAAGADAVKYQFWSSAKRLADRRRAPSYEAIYAKYQVPVVWLSWLKQACDAAGIEFMVTCYLPEDLPVVAPLVRRWKVASFEASDVDFVRAHAAYGKEILVSTGMSTGPLTYHHDGRGVFAPTMPRLQIRSLHCVSAYPTPLDQANLGVLRHRYEDGSSDYAGYSDHTCSTLTGGLAVVAGAAILEVHFRLSDTSPDNPDYATALSPTQLRDYVDFVRLVERMLGSGEKKPQPAEAAMQPYRVQS